MTNREWLNSLSNEELAKWKILNMCAVCVYAINEGEICQNGGRDIRKGCPLGISEWLNKKHIEPMPTLKAGDIVQTKPYCRYVAIDPIILVRAESKERVFLCDIGDIVMIWRSEGEEYQCIWEG